MSNEETVTIELTCGEADWLRGYLVADSVTAKRIRDKIPHTFYKVGDRFRLEDGFYAGNEYILASVGSGQVCLIDVNRGERWNNPVEVDHAYNITRREFARITRDKVTFKKI